MGAAGWHGELRSTCLPAWSAFGLQTLDCPGEADLGWHRETGEEPSLEQDTAEQRREGETQLPRKPALQTSLVLMQTLFCSSPGLPGSRKGSGSHCPGHSPTGAG